VRLPKYTQMSLRTRWINSSRATKNKPSSWEYRYMKIHSINSLNLRAYVALEKSLRKQFSRYTPRDINIHFAYCPHTISKSVTPISTHLHTNTPNIFTMKFTLTLTVTFLAFTLVTAIKPENPNYVGHKDEANPDVFKVLSRYFFCKLNL